MRMLNTQLPTVVKAGAKAGQYLVGMSECNRYLILQILEDQPPNQKQLVGRFLLVQVGIGHYAPDVEPLVGQQLTAAEVTTHVHSRHPEKKWVHIITPDQLAVVPSLPKLRKQIRQQRSQSSL